MVHLHKPEIRSGRSYYRCSVKVNGKTKRVTLGHLNTRAAEQLKLLIEELESANYAGSALSVSVQERLERIDSTLLTRLVSAGLIEKSCTADPVTLQSLVEAYHEHKLLSSQGRTVRNYTSTLRRLVDHFGSSCCPGSISEQDVETFVSECISQGKAASTIKNYLRRAKELYSFAIRRNLVSDNPFATEIQGRFQVRLDAAKLDRQHAKLSRETLDQLLACRKSLRCEFENLEWDALIHIYRYLGCRRGEALILRWQDVDFANNCIKIRGKRNGSATNCDSDGMSRRISLLWPELRPPLERLRQSSSESEVYLFNSILSLRSKPEFEEVDSQGKRVRSGRYESNVANTFKKILRRNGIPVWPQPIHALRRYRVNELETDEQLKLRTVEIREFLGHTERTAQGYYSNVSQSDIERLLGKARAATQAAQSPGLANGRAVDAIFNRMPPDQCAAIVVSPRKPESETVRAMSVRKNARPAGFEPATLGSEDRCAIQLRHGRVKT